MCRSDFRRIGQWGLLSSIALCGGCSGVAWQRDLESGLRQAADTDRRVVIEFYLMSSTDCRKMDAEVFEDPHVRQLMERFIPVRLDALVSRELMEKYNLKDVPSFVVLRPDRELAGTTTGPLNAEKFRSFLIKNSYN